MTYYEDGLYWLLTLISSIPYSLFSIAVYVLTSLSLYTVARRRGIRKAWLSWIPVVNCWILGSLSDQYQYVVHGQVRNKRKVLLALNLLKTALLTALIVVMTVMVITLFTERTGAFLGSVYGLLGMLLPLGAVAITYCVLDYFALFDLFKSLDPDYCIPFLVLCVLFTPIRPFLLFFSREKDKGMPPRRAVVDAAL